MSSKEYYIVNNIDRPYEKLVAVRKGDLLYYINRELKDDYPGMGMNTATKMEAFGFDIISSFDGNAVSFKKVRPSTATYGDGEPRDWQGRSQFTYDHLGFLHY
jgi:hypothetical protein